MMIIALMTTHSRLRKISISFSLNQWMNGGVLFILDDDYKLSVVQIANDRLSSAAAKLERNFFPSLTHFIYLSTRDD